MTTATAPHVQNSATSKAAADQVSGTMKATQQRTILRALFLAGVNGCTRDELQVGCMMDGNSCRPRCAELIGVGLVEKSDEVRRTASGRKAEVLVLSMAGKLALGEVP